VARFAANYLGVNFVRIAIFIDAGYLNKVLENEIPGPKIKLDYGKLAAHAVNQINPTLDILRTYYYHCLPYQSNPPTEDEKARFSKAQSFIEKLDDLPSFQVRLGQLQRKGTPGAYQYEQKRIDVLMSIDIVELSATRQITHAAIMAGDSDFCPAVEVAKRNGVSVWLFHGRTPHIELRRMADNRVCIDEEFCTPIRYIKR